MNAALNFLNKFMAVWIAMLILAIYLNFFSPKLKQYRGQTEEYRKYRRMKQ